MRAKWIGHDDSISLYSYREISDIEKAFQYVISFSHSRYRYISRHFSPKLRLSDSPEISSLFRFNAMLSPSYLVSSAVGIAE